MVAARSTDLAPALEPLDAASDTSHTGEPDTARSVLLEEEVARSRAFARASTVLCGISFVFHQLVGGTPLLHAAASAGLVGFGTLSAFMWQRLRHPVDRAAWTTLMRVYGLAALVVGVVFQLFMGVFSPMAAVVVFGISFYALGERTRTIVGYVALLAIAYVVAACLVTFEVVPDFGLFAPHVPFAARLTMTIVITSVYALACLQARSTRRATTEAIERAAEMARAVRQQEGQLLEVQQSLDLVLGAGAGRRGAYTGTTAGPWRLAEVIGRGAMGEVYAAQHATTGGAAAVKLLHATARQELALVRRFLREVEIATKLRGANLVRVFDVGEAADGAPYIAMERLVGRDLGACLREEPRMSLEAVASLVDDVARGLTVAHGAGIVHRDLKPQNIFRAERVPQPTWVILDFSIAKLGASSGTLTEGAVIGTPGYMAPEQATGDESDPRADVYSLGAVVYRAVTGSAPFAGKHSTRVLYEVVHGSPVRPRDLVPELPHDVESTLAIALARDPERRFESVTSFARAFRRAIRGDLGPPLRARADLVVKARPWAGLTRS